MKHNAIKHIRKAVFVLTVLVCITAVSAAFANPASYVDIGTTTLNTSSPYWKNGGGGTASDWNAYFDTSTSVPTLRLNNAVIDSLNSYGVIIEADGDLILELTGDSFCTATVTVDPYPAGIYVDGNLTVTGAAGSLTISITHTHSLIDAFTDGIYLAGGGTLTIVDGAVHIILSDSATAYGVYTSGILDMQGGALTLSSTAPNVSALKVQQLLMTGGTVDVTTDARSSISYALQLDEASVSGGYGSFTCDGSGNALRCSQAAVEAFRVIDGRMVFSAQDAALFFTTNDSPIPYVTGEILVAQSASGTGKTKWMSALGPLASNNLTTSSFRYVELVGGTVETPGTGDTAKPWLWLIIGVAALGAGAFLFLWFRRRK